MIITNLTSALGWTLLHSLWQGSLIFLLVAPLLLLLKNRSPQLRYHLCLSALLLFVGAMVWTFSGQLTFALPGPELPTEVSLVTAADLSAAESPTILTTATVPAPPVTTVVAASPFSLPQFLGRNVDYLVAAWGIGVLLFTFRWCNMLLFTYRMRKRGTRELPRVWQERLLALRKRMGITRRVGLLASTQIDTPLVIGYLKPVVLLPVGLINGLTVAQVEAILAHELAHVGRRDFLVNLLLTSLEVVLFYHPVYWWLMARINEEREQCCDDAAVAACGNPRMYARTLLSVEEYRHSGYLTMAFAKEGGQLQERIKRICRVAPTQRQVFSLRLWLLLPLLGFIAAFAYAGTAPDGGEDTTDLLQELAEESSPLPDETTPIAEVVAPATTSVPRTETPLEESLPKPNTIVTATLPSVTDPVTSLSNQRNLPKLEVVIPAFSLGNTDSLPQPVVPVVEEDLKLPAPPTFSLSESEIENLLAKGSEGRSALRNAISDYREEIYTWDDEVEDGFLDPWGAHRGKIMEAYERWSADLRAQAPDELTYALAHEKQTEVFEQAFELHEATLEVAENSIEEQLEDNLEFLENRIERSENKLKEHSDRMEVHSIRMGMHAARMNIHSGRMRVHTGRMRMHTARMRMHTARMKSYQIITDALEAELRETLIADGLLEKGEQDFSYELTYNEMTFNGKKIESEQLQQKYRAILARYGKDNMGLKKGNTFMIHHRGGNSTIGTSKERN